MVTMVMFFLPFFFKKSQFFFLKISLVINVFYWNICKNNFDVGMYYQIISYLNNKNNFMILILILCIENFTKNQIIYNRLVFPCGVVLIIFFWNSEFLNEVCSIYNSNYFLGANLNTNLLNGLMLVHPPLLYYLYSTYLYMCIYVTVFKKNYLFLNKKNSFLMVQLVLIALTTLLLGSWWAEQELSWGGWWSWDLVELLLLNLCIYTIYLCHFFYPNNNNVIFDFKFLQTTTVLFNCVVLSIFIVRFNIINSIHNFINIDIYNQYLYYIIFYGIFKLFKILSQELWTVLNIFIIKHFSTKLNIWGKSAVNGLCGKVVVIDNQLTIIIKSFSWFLFWVVVFILLLLLHIINKYIYNYINVQLYIYKYIYYIIIYYYIIYVLYNNILLYNIYKIIYIYIYNLIYINIYKYFIYTYIYLYIIINKDNNISNTIKSIIYIHVCVYTLYIINTIHVYIFYKSTTPYNILFGIQIFKLNTHIDITNEINSISFSKILLETQNLTTWKYITNNLYNNFLYTNHQLLFEKKIFNDFTILQEYYNANHQQISQNALLFVGFLCLSLVLCLMSLKKQKTISLFYAHNK